MGKQINQYTKVRTKFNISVFDLLDFDSTDDNGTTYESAKCTVLDMLAYLQSTLPTIYGGDGTLAAGANGDRNITANSIETKTIGGSISVEMSDAVNDYGFLIRDTTQTKRAGLFYSQSNDLTYLEVDFAGNLTDESFINFKYANTNDEANLHANSILHISTNFREKIIIGADQSSANSGLLPAWQGSNSTYQQVQINNVNFRGNVSFGNGLNSSTPIIGIGSDYSEIRFNNLFLRWNNGTYGGPSFTTNGGAKFSFIDVYNRQLMEIARNNLNSRTLSLKTQLATNETDGSLLHHFTSLQLEGRYWSKDLGDATGADTLNTFEIKHNRFSLDGGVNYISSMNITYDSNDAIKIFEDGSISLENIPTTAPSQSNRVWNDAGTLKIT